jgi:hypothetical protein
MKACIQELYESILPYDSKFNILVTRDLLPSIDCEYNVSGYRISFVDIKKGLLRKNKYGRGYLSAPDWLESYGNEGGVDTLFVSEEGMDLVDKLGYDWFRNEVFQPEKWGGEEISHGSESKIFKANLAGKECVVKLEYEGIEALNKIAKIFRSQYMTPNYLRKFGITKKINKYLSEINKLWPFRTFELDESPIEYVANKNFMIEEYKEGASLQKVKDCIEDTKRSKIFDTNKKGLEKVISKFEEEIGEIGDLFFLVGYEREHLCNEIDFALSDWIMTKFDSEKKKIRLSLIDQAPAGIARDSTVAYVHELEEATKYNKLNEKLKDNPILNHLMNLSV